MKRIITFFAALAMGFCAFAQEEQDGVAQPLYFYGVDFSEAKVVGAKASADDIEDAIEDFNKIFLSDPSKYLDPLETRLKRKFDKVDISYAMKACDDVDEDDVVAYATPEEFNSLQVAKMLKGLRIKPCDGTGLVVFANCMDHGRGKCTFYFVFFDNRSIEITETLVLVGNASGKGLIPFWGKGFNHCCLEINPTKFYTKSQNFKAKVNETVENIKAKR